MVTIPVGEMRQTISLVDPKASGNDSYGQPILNTSPYTTTYASLAQLSGKELFKAQQFVSDATHLVTIYFRTGVMAEQTVQYRGRNFRIQYIENPEERDIVLKLYCVEINGTTGPV